MIANGILKSVIAIRARKHASDAPLPLPSLAAAPASPSRRCVAFSSVSRRPCVGEVAMRDMASKMAELKFEAPLAQFEETDDWTGSTEFANNKNEDEINLNRKNNMDLLNEDVILNDNSNTSELMNAKNTVLSNTGSDTASVADNFTETFSGSLEDLVNTFDEKITKCFGNYEESVEKLAPVQVRTQEEIMNECQ